MKQFESTLTRALEVVLALGLLTIVCVVVLQVILSFVFNSSITGANELITKLFVYTTAIGAAVAVGRQEHITIDFAVERLPRRARVITDLVSLGLIAVLNLVIVYYSIRWVSVTGNYLMPTTQLPRYLAQLAVPVGCGLAVLYCLIRVISRSAELRTPAASE